MLTAARDTYLETQVHTATPQRLRLMLLDGALRFARQTQELWQRNESDAAYDSLVRCRDIVGELIAGIQADASPLAKTVLNLHLYLFSALTEAQLKQDQQQLAAVIAVLEEERETWQRLCEQFPERPSAAAAAAITSREEIAPAFVGGAEQFSLDA